MIVITSAFWLVPDSGVPFFVRARRTALAEDFFAFHLAGATSVAGCATSGDKRCTVSQIRVDRDFPAREFLDWFQVVERRHACEAVPGVD
jgi:hypothetical protein